MKIQLIIKLNINTNTNDYRTKSITVTIAYIQNILFIIRYDDGYKDILPFSGKILIKVIMLLK